MYTHNHYFFDYLTNWKRNKMKTSAKKKQSCDLVIQNQNLEVYHNHTHPTKRNERHTEKKTYRSSLCFRRVHIYIFSEFQWRRIWMLAICRWNPCKKGCIYIYFWYFEHLKQFDHWLICIELWILAVVVALVVAAGFFFLQFFQNGLSLRSRQSIVQDCSSIDNCTFFALSLFPSLSYSPPLT